MCTCDEGLVKVIWTTSTLERAPVATDVQKLFVQSEWNKADSGNVVQLSQGVDGLFQCIKAIDLRMCLV